jgi:hypothetical protein
MVEFLLLNKFRLLLLFLIWLPTLGACTESFPLEVLPTSFECLSYSKGFNTGRVTVVTGDPVYDALRSFLEANRTGWSGDLRTYAPSIYFKSESVTVNCGEDTVVVNYRGDMGSTRWIQISNPVKGCRAAVVEALLKLKRP